MGLVRGGAVMVKAVSGGGGRGMRAVTDPDVLSDAYARCASEAVAAFGDGALYVEQLVTRARHLEVQVVGDGAAVVALGERECTLQRRHQKVVEVAPSPGASAALRKELADAALTVARAVGLDNVGTFEFLVDAADPTRWWFLEANPRLQVEHTVTEAVTGVDLVQAQLRLALGATLADLDLLRPVEPTGMALQLRVNVERTGTLTRFEVPTGPGVRVDTCGTAGWAPSPRFDALLAKLVVHTTRGGWPELLAQAGRAAGEFRIEGVDTNLEALRALLVDPEVVAGRVHTAYLDERWPAPTVAASGDAVAAPLQGTIVAVDVEPGDEVAAGAALVVLEAMKMEHVVAAPHAGRVLAVNATVGETVEEGRPLVTLTAGEGGGTDEQREDGGVDLDRIRPDLAEVMDRLARTRDAARPAAVARRRERGQRTARENVDDLLDPGSLARVRRAGGGGSAPTPLAGRARGDDPRRRADRRHGHRERASASAREPRESPCSPTTPPCWPAPRGCATTSRRTASSRWPPTSACRWCSSRRAVAAGRATPTTAM